MMSIDEMMIKTKSKFTKCKIYNLKKPIRDGIKIEALCDSLTGYFHTFHVHMSSNENLLQVGSKTMNVVVTLVSQLPFTSFQIIMDNYYSSIQTFRYLHNMKHNAIGTVQRNRIALELVMKKSTLKGTVN
jgi:superfamily II DNA helicase RecQ